MAETKKVAIKTTPLNGTPKGNEKKTQYQIVREVFAEPKSALMCSIETNVLQGSIYRYIDTMLREGVIQCIGERLDKYTHQYVHFYTTDKKLWVQNTDEKKQLTIDFWGGIKL